ncbi:MULTISPECIES: accessory Sec system translocase SecA2 [unclassified Paenibacillus]|uniref:preprotein translocase subunit SecA n=1 Tax=unclassified Paenibacillus TaxID=185978 RepID=UPI002406769A|nr:MULTISPECIES: accessory Sec system translocase SecA2 [unclassified Paenibacillus]MDF9839044.1 preprotein translocase subunit SecA [Paenibacillus sp. PastF-2]MDF9845626.1 preprotein translocase subunit SecA [Paenibacillus sp. PastM-2]MDF9852198.1 preprotein translocase subunit SecA [Paenibacillus sp. PastF-1]MDH6478073.1 preprotein translocase subunit SecA [Paenibacillus sp. PastH-2]MDH6505807.1 preprotein translocase subunit SecA [Paenibacillus sp. PastM-3]
MNIAGRLLRSFKNYDNHNKLKGLEQRAELIRARNLADWDDRQLQKESLRLRTAAKSGTALNELLVDAYALVCEAAKRTLGLQPYKVQIMAAIALHDRYLVEQHTGEGKTLSAVMPAYLNALTGEGVHVLTFNDYLASRDAEWMGPAYRFLGLSVSAVQAGMSLPLKREAYASDITYVTAKEAGFDYLRDSIVLTEADTVHRPFHFVIVDEADSLLLDEARVPLVISGDTSASTSEGQQFAEVARQLQQAEHYEFDDFKRNVYLNEAGAVQAELLLGCGNLYDSHNAHLLTSLNCALHVEALMNRDVDYIVRDGKIELIEEYTGRVAENRYLPEGLQAALVAKEGLRSFAGGKILGTITVQHFISLYPKICGMTATARASAMEFEKLYSLQVVQIPPNRSNIRIDHPYRVYTHKEAKLHALVKDISSVHTTGRPILIGTSSVEESDQLAEALTAAGVPCHVLNAKNDAEEAGIIAKAGVLGAVTVSTNMAGRGVDIRLGGGDPGQAEVVARLGGLYVIGTHVNESVRIDNQLRGRSGRQGDPGSSVFYVSLEDEVMLRFGNITSPTARQDEALADPALCSTITHIQRVIMGQNFEIHQELNGYSDMVEDQRRILYSERLDILRGKQKLSPSEQRVRLFYIDEFWADHLAFISYLRESIHLESLASRNPIDEFHGQITQAYEQLHSKIDNAATDMLARLGGSNDPADWEKLGLMSPPSTRTYIINDQYISDKRSSWTAATVMSYWLRKPLKWILSPVVKLPKY